jgi:hypothetical protein
MTERIAPLVPYLEDGRIDVVASKGGADTNPDWYVDLVAHPRGGAGAQSACQCSGSVVAPPRDALRVKLFQQRHSDSSGGSQRPLGLGDGERLRQ